MTANRPDLNDEQFEQLLNRTGQQLSYPPMRDGVQAAMSRIRSEQMLVRNPNPNNHVALSDPWTGPDTDPALAVYPADGEPERSRWREIGLLAGGIAAAAVVTLVLVLVFRGFGSGGESGDVVPGAAPSIKPVAFSDAALAGSILMARQDPDGNSVIVPVDPETGESTPGYEPIVGFLPDFGLSESLSADRSTLVTVESHDRACEPISGGTACHATADVIHVVDVVSWKDRTVNLPGDSWESGMDISRDGQYFAIALTSPGLIGSPGTTMLMIYDTSTLIVVAEREIDFRPSLVRFALDDTALTVYGQQLAAEHPGVDRPDPPRLITLDPESLEIRYEIVFTDLMSGYWCIEDCSGSIQDWAMTSWRPGVALTPDRSDLVVVSANLETMMRVDLATGDIREMEIRSAATWFSWIAGLFISDVAAKGEVNGVSRELAWSADGTRLYILTVVSDGTREGNDNDGLLQIINSESGQLVVERTIDPATFISAPPVTRDLIVRQAALATEPWVAVFSADTLQPQEQLNGWKVAVTSTLDGQAIMLAKIDGEGSSELAMVDMDTYDILRVWTIESERCSLFMGLPVCQPGQ